jgi:hypothetical protein
LNVAETAKEAEAAAQPPTSRAEERSEQGGVDLSLPLFDGDVDDADPCWEQIYHSVASDASLRKIIDELPSLLLAESPRILELCQPHPWPACSSDAIGYA